jgi:hypothetical protein
MGESGAAVRGPQFEVGIRTGFVSSNGIVAGLLFCAAFVVFSFFAREQPANTYVRKKADRLVRSAGSAVPAN